MRSAFAPCLTLAVSLSVPVFGQVAVPGQSALPVREITVFKDGHAFLLRQGKVTIGTDNAVKLTEVPNPVLGTFWPYSSDKSLPLKAVVAGREPIQVEKDAASIVDFLQANIGAKVRIERTYNDAHPIEGTVLSLAPTMATAVNSESPGFVAPPTQISTVVLQTEAGILPLPISQIGTVLLPNGSKTRFAETSQQNVLNLQFDNGAAGKTVDVGMMYLQKGLRWIPNYKVTLDGKGNADVGLQATLINDLIDFSDTSLNLVIGVPNFAFKDTPDPIGMQDVFSRLSRYFSSDSPTASNFSNSIMSQQSRMGERDGGVSGGGASIPEFSSAERNEDLFLFNIKHVSLKLGQRMTLPVTRFTIPYHDIFTMELLPSPPQVAGGGFDPNGDPNLARLLSQPIVKHQARLDNTSSYPLTTAPALLMRDDRVLAQSLMTYTAMGGKSDLFVTNAVDVSGKRQDVELKRTPNAVEINRMAFSQVEENGTVTVTSYRKTPTELEVTRYVAGEVSSADHDGAVVVLDTFNEPAEISEYRARYSDYARYNKLTRITWKLTLAPGQTVTLSYLWSYLFR